MNVSRSQQPAYQKQQILHFRTLTSFKYVPIFSLKTFLSKDGKKGITNEHLCALETGCNVQNAPRKYLTHQYKKTKKKIILFCRRWMRSADNNDAHHSIWDRLSCQIKRTKDSGSIGVRFSGGRLRPMESLLSIDCPCSWMVIFRNDSTNVPCIPIHFPSWQLGDTVARNFVWVRTSTFSYSFRTAKAPRWTHSPVPCSPPCGIRDSPWDTM